MPKKPHEIDVANPPRAGKSVKFMALHLARQLGKTERARLEALQAAYRKASDSGAPTDDEFWTVGLEELRRRGYELVRRG